MSQKHLFSTLITILILSFILTQTDVKRVLGLNISSVVSLQTIPTRTPTPGPANTPAPNPTKSNDGGGSSTAVPTSTPQSLPTNTPTPIITIAFTPVGGFVPTAESCSNQPTIQVQNPTNVRLGPGTNYPVVGQLVYLEVRFILGRAADAAWWLILLDDGSTGWVADDVVTVQGYIGVVAVVPAPEINGQTPTPGTPWNPTPPPFCTVTPTATATETAVPSFTPSPATTVSESAATASAPQPAADTANTATPEPQPTQTAVAPPTLVPTNIPDNQTTRTPGSQTVGDDSNSSVSTLDDTSGATVDFILPLVGILFAVAIVITISRRIKNKDIPD